MRRTEYLAKVAVVAAAYFCGAKFGLSLASDNESITAVWPPTGIALAALVLWGYRLWPGVALGALLANAWTGVPLITVLGITTGNTLEALLGAFLLVRVARFRPSLERGRDVLALAVLAGAMSTVASATIGVASLWAGGATEPSELASAWRLWWLGDMGGDLVVAPLLFVLAGGLRPSRDPRRIAEASALLISLLVIGGLVFAYNGSFPFLVFPPLIWAALRFGQRGAAAANVLVAAFAISSTARGLGPFVQGSADSNLLLSTTFVGVVSITALLLAAVMSERKHAETGLRRAGHELEQRIRERTAALDRAQALAHIGSWHWDVSANAVTWSDELFRIYGLEPQSVDITYESFLERTHPEDRNLVDDTVRRCYETGDPFAFDHRIVRPDGSVRWLHGRGEVDMSESGPFTMSGTGQDITERRQGEERFRRLLESAPDAMVIADKRGEILLVNAQTEVLFGHARDELVGRPVEVLVPELFHGDHPGHRDDYLANPGVRPMGAGLELHGRRRDGHEFPVEISLAPLETAEGAVVSAAIRDVTERRRAEQKLREREEHYRSIVDTANDAFVSIDANGFITDWNRAAELAFGWPREEVVGRSLAETIIPAPHRDAHKRGLQRFLDTGEGPLLNRRLELTALHREGREVPVELTVWPVRSGNASSFNAFLRDISERKAATEALRRSREHYRSIVETAGEAFVGVDDRGVITEWNPQAEALFGWARKEAIGKPYRELIIPPRYREQHQLGLQRFLATRRGRAFSGPVEFAALRKDGCEFPIEVRISAIRRQSRYRFNAFAHDITERKRAEEERARLLAAEQRARSEAEAASEMLRRLEGVTSAAYLTVDDLGSELLERTCEMFHADVAALLLRDLERDTLNVRGARGLGDEVEQDAATAVDTGFAERVAAEREPVIVEDVHQAEPHRAMLREKGVCSLVGVPLLSGEDKVLGVLYLGTLRPRRFTEQDVRLLELVADRAGLAIARTRFYEDEREAVETLQRSLLPQLPDIPGVDMAARYASGGTGSEIGGDWYDVLALPGGKVGIAIGDVAGRGIGAASVMGQMRNALRAYALEGLQPATVLDRLNRLVEYSAPGEMATFVYASFDPATCTLRFVRAGHPPPLLVAPDGAARFLDTGTTLPLGARRARMKQEGREHVEPGSTLLFYTDGLVERRGAALSEGLARLKRAAASGPGGLEALCEHILRACAARASWTDDVALLAVRPTPALVADRVELVLPADPDVLAPLRAMLGRWLEKIEARPEDAYAITLACCEASANAIEHAYGPGHASFSVEAALDGRDAVVRVRDSGRWRGPRGRNRGRGINLMEALMDGVEVKPTQAGTEVRFRRNIGEMTVR